MVKPTTAYNALRSFFAFAHRYKWGLLVVGFIFIISNITLALVPVFVGQLIDTLAHQASPWLWVWLLIGASIITRPIMATRQCRLQTLRPTN